MKRFVILGNHRSGSTLLASWLHGHPQIICHGEIFHRRIQVKTDKGISLDRDELERFSADWRALLNAIFAQQPRVAAVGFKMWQSQKPEACRYLLADEDVFKIILVRRNVLARYSSHLLATRDRIWIQHRGQDLPSRFSEAPLDDFDRQGFLKFVKLHFDMYGFYKVFSRGRTLSLDYEQLVQQGATTVVRFLGLDPHGQKAPIDKVRSSNILSRFETRLHPEILATLEALKRPEWVAEFSDTSSATNLDPAASSAEAGAATV